MDHKSSVLIGNIALWGIAGLGTLFFLMIMFGQDSGIDGGLYLTYVAFGLGILLALASGVMSLLHSASIKSMLMPLGAFIVLFGISYFLADGAVKPSWGITESASKLIGAGLIMTSLAALIAVVAAIYGWVSSFFK